MSNLEDKCAIKPTREVWKIWCDTEAVCQKSRNHCFAFETLKAYTFQKMFCVPVLWRRIYEGRKLCCWWCSEQMQARHGLLASECMSVSIASISTYYNFFEMFCQYTIKWNQMLLLLSQQNEVTKSNIVFQKYALEKKIILNGNSK